MKRAFNSIGLIIICVLFVWACKKDGDVEVTKSQEKRNALMEEIYNKEIKPKNDSLGLLLDDLKAVHHEFTHFPEAPELLATQKKWLEVAKLTAQCKLFNVTPIARRFYFINMHSFPISEEFLNAYGDAYKNWAVVDASAYAVNRKGLAMLEHLFYEQDSLDLYNALVVGYIDDLKENQEAISDYWEEELHDHFISGATISINDGYGELINSFVSTIEVSKKERFDKPFGLNSDQKYDFEAEYSQSSKILFATTFSYMEYLLDTYYCSFLFAEGEEDLAKDIQAAFKEYNTSFAGLSGTTFESVQDTASASELEAVQDDLLAILRLIRVDLATAYEVLISFSDADGD